jgi:hypothetical protein
VQVAAKGNYAADGNFILIMLALFKSTSIFAAV